MTALSPRTAIIVPIELPQALERLRLAGDPMARLGVPAHVTLLFPFLAAADVTGEVLDVVGEVVAGEPAIEVELAAVRRFPPSSPSVDAVLWLAPEPAEPFSRLTGALANAFPAYRPYGGIHDEVIPHLTIATGVPARLDALEAVMVEWIPVRRPVVEAALLIEDAQGRWSVEERFGLG